MKFQGFVGPSYKLDSVNVDCQRCVNLYPEMIESGTGKEAQVDYLKSTPGLRKLIDVGLDNGPIRMIHVDPHGRVFVAAGDKMYKLSFDGTDWSFLRIGPVITLSTSTGPIIAASTSSGPDQAATVFVDGVNSYLHYFSVPGGIDEFNTFADFGYPVVPGATHVAFVDGYFIYNEGGTNNFHVSNWDDFAADPLLLAAAEGDPDKIVAIIACNRDLWILNERSTEVFSDVGNPDFPFERVQGGFIEKGCLAPYSVAKIDSFVIWLGRDEFGAGMIYAVQGLTPQRISTHAVEAAIARYASPENAVAYTYQDRGHMFYVLSFDEATWVYDSTTKLWHERAFTNGGTLERHRAAFHCYIPQYKIHMAGDYANSKIYQFDEDYCSDDGAELTRMRTFPHVSSGGNRVFCSQFILDMETGVGLDGGVQGSDPKVMLDYSDDGGHAFKNETWMSAGTSSGGIGDFKKRVIWRRLGSFRDRVFRVKVTDPVKVTFNSVDIELQQGAS